MEKANLFASESLSKCSVQIVYEILFINGNKEI